MTDPDRNTGRTSAILLTAAAQIATDCSIKNVVIVGHSSAAAAYLGIKLRQILDAAGVPQDRLTFHPVATGARLSPFDKPLVVRDHGC